MGINKTTKNMLDVSALLHCFVDDGLKVLQPVLNRSVHTFLNVTKFDHLNDLLLDPSEIFKILSSQLRTVFTLFYDDLSSSNGEVITPLIAIMILNRLAMLPLHSPFATSSFSFCYLFFLLFLPR